jgi:hypothetical protein
MNIDINTFYDHVARQSHIRVAPYRNDEQTRAIRNSNRTSEFDITPSEGRAPDCIRFDLQRTCGDDFSLLNEEDSINSAVRTLEHRRSVIDNETHTNANTLSSTDNDSITSDSEDDESKRTTSTFRMSLSKQMREIANGYVLGKRLSFELSLQFT